MKLDARLLRYLTAEDFRVLTAVCGRRTHITALGTGR